jgi:hypothetical protein
MRKNAITDPKQGGDEKDPQKRADERRHEDSEVIAEVVHVHGCV